jgi:hypothetical protein
LIATAPTRNSTTATLKDHNKKLNRVEGRLK